MNYFDFLNTFKKKWLLPIICRNHYKKINVLLIPTSGYKQFLNILLFWRWHATTVNKYFTVLLQTSIPAWNTMKIFAHKYLNANMRLIAYLRNISQNKISFKEPYTKYKDNVVNYILFLGRGQNRHIEFMHLMFEKSSVLLLLILN